MFGKRGLSDVVTTVLIILIALGALGIIISFLMPMIKQGSSEITSVCTSLQLEPVKCTYKQINGVADNPSTTNIDETVTGINTTTVLVKRNTGEAELKEIKVIFYAINGETITKTMTSANVPGLLETKVFTTTEVNGPIKEFSVAGVIVTEAEDEKICRETFKEKCTTD